MGFKPFLPIVHKLAAAPLDHLSPKQERADSAETARLHAKFAIRCVRDSQLVKRYDDLTEHLKLKKIYEFDKLAKRDQHAKKGLVELAQETDAIILEGINICFFGWTSTGKSTMLNALLGQKVAETGVGETTTEITAYTDSTLTLWDVPGGNDELNYLSLEYIAFLKGLTRRVILVQTTVREKSSLLEILDEIGLDYDIVFSKFDQVNPEDRAQVQQQTRSEVQKTRLRGVKKMYFVSAKDLRMFDD